MEGIITIDGMSYKIACEVCEVPLTEEQLQQTAIQIRELELNRLNKSQSARNQEQIRAASQIQDKPYPQQNSDLRSRELSSNAVMLTMGSCVSSITQGATQNINVSLPTPGQAPFTYNIYKDSISSANLIATSGPITGTTYSPSHTFNESIGSHAYILQVTDSCLPTHQTATDQCNVNIVTTQICNNLVFVHGGDNALYYRYKENDRYTFDNWISLSGHITSKPVSSYFKNNVYVFARGGDNGLWYRSFNLSNKTWSPWNSLGGGLLSFPVITQNPNQMFAFVRGTDYQLYYRATSDGNSWSSWRGLGGYLLSDPACTFFQNTSLGTQIYTFCVGGDKNCYFQYSSNGGNTWSGWVNSGRPSSSVSFTASQPSIISGPDGKLYVFFTGTDNSAYFSSFDSHNFTNWAYLGGYLPSSPVAISVGNKIYVVCRGRDNAVYYKAYYNNTWYPSQIGYWYSLGGSIQGDPSLGSVCGILYVSVRGSDNGLWYITTDGSTWDTYWRGLSGSELTDPSMATM